MATYSAGYLNVEGSLTVSTGTASSVNASTVTATTINATTVNPKNLGITGLQNLTMAGTATLGDVNLSPTFFNNSGDCYTMAKPSGPYAVDMFQTGMRQASYTAAGPYDASSNNIQNGAPVGARTITSAYYTKRIIHADYKADTSISVFVPSARTDFDYTELQFASNLMVDPAGVKGIGGITNNWWDRLATTGATGPKLQGSSIANNDWNRTTAAASALGTAANWNAVKNTVNFRESSKIKDHTKRYWPTIDSSANVSSTNYNTATMMSQVPPTGAGTKFPIVFMHTGASTTAAATMTTGTPELLASYGYIVVQMDLGITLSTGRNIGRTESIFFADTSGNLNCNTNATACPRNDNTKNPVKITACFDTPLVWFDSSNVNCNLTNSPNTATIPTLIPCWPQIVDLEYPTPSQYSWEKNFYDYFKNVKTMLKSCFSDSIIDYNNCYGYGSSQGGIMLAVLQNIARGAGGNTKAIYPLADPGVPYYPPSSFNFLDASNNAANATFLMKGCVGLDPQISQSKLAGSYRPANYGVSGFQVPCFFMASQYVNYSVGRPLFSENIQFMMDGSAKAVRSSSAAIIKKSIHHGGFDGTTSTSIALSDSSGIAYPVIDTGALMMGMGMDRLEKLNLENYAINKAFVIWIEYLNRGYLATANNAGSINTGSSLAATQTASAIEYSWVDLALLVQSFGAELDIGFQNRLGYQNEFPSLTVMDYGMDEDLSGNLTIGPNVWYQGQWTGDRAGSNPYVANTPNVIMNMSAVVNKNMTIGTATNTNTLLTIIDASGNSASMTGSKWAYLINTVLAGR